MRPVGLGPFNYSFETYSRSLWVAEGITSYYDDLVLRRAEIYSVGEYLDAFCSNIDQMDSLPGSAWQSAEESSFDAWIKHYRQDENSPNVVSSYYVQGAVVGWMIDMAIRVNTRSGRNLDDVLRKVYQDTYKKQDRGYTDEEFESACNEIAGGDLSSSIFDRRGRGREKVEYNLYLSYAGLRLGPKTKQPQDDERGFLGVKLKSDGGRILVLSRLSGSPAESSGLSAGDEIIGADGTRMDQSALSYYLSNRVPGDRVQLLIAREGRLKEVGSNLSSRPVFEHRIYKIDTATPEQKDLFAKWLLSDWEAEIVYPDIAPSPVKRQFFDYI
jgi:predicted metalloprotease with PDZ domain